MTIQEKIKELRALLEEEEISALIIPSTDNHFGEYIPDYYKVIPWLSGFSGTDSTLVVTTDKVALWTDSRYFIQAEAQLKDTGIILMKMKVAGTPSIVSWLKKVLPEDAIVAMDEDLFSYQEYSSYVDALYPINTTLIEDPFDKIWKDRPSIEFKPIRLLPEDVSGESIASKHKRLYDKLYGLDEDATLGSLAAELPIAYIISSCDEIMWLCNLRGSDIEFNPLALSYAVALPDKICLFLNLDSLDARIESYLYEQNVVIYPYDEFTSFLNKLDRKYVRMFSGNRITAKNYFAAMENIYNPPVFQPLEADVTVGGTLASMKSIKNKVELEGFVKAYAEDTKVWNKLLNFIEDNIINKSEEEYYQSPITEIDLANKLIEFRRECPDYIGESFSPIVAWGENAALPHYELSEENPTVIRKEGFLLMDLGAQYSYGTTDTTRTIAVGDFTDEMRDDYTAVLKGMIDLSMAKFVHGMRGASLDILAREPIIKREKIYRHGTSHGIGHFLNVHEGPVSIRMEDNGVLLEENMVLSNEPGIYIDGKYGIRSENTLLSKLWTKNNFGAFYKFETLTRVKFDEKPINFSMLTKEEHDWLEDYQSKCR